MSLRLLSLLFLFFLSACGGGGGGSSGASVSGQFVASYVKGLKVCDDRGHCSYTDQTGRFLLSDVSLPVNLTFFVDNLKLGSYLLKENGEVINPFKLAGDGTVGDRLAKFIHGMAKDIDGTEQILDLSEVKVLDSSVPEDAFLTDVLSENETVVVNLQTGKGERFTVKYTPDVGVELCEGETCFSVNYRQWLFLVYMAADNNLNDYAFKDLNEMASINFVPQVKLVVLTDFSTEADRISESDEVTGKLVSHSLDYEVDSGSYETLKNFIETYYNRYPAKNVVLILWDHGDGWRGSRVAALDDTDQNLLLMFQLRKVLSDLKDENVTFSIIGFDECLMGMEEVLYDIKDFADYFVVSENYEPMDGWDYSKVLSYIVNNPYASVESFGRAIVDAFRDTYRSNQSGYTLTLTLFTRNDVEEIASKLNTFDDYLNSESFEDFESARSSAQTLPDVPYVDLYSFVSSLDSTKYPEAGDIARIIDNLYKAVIPGSDGRELHGLSIYFPANRKEADDSGFSCYALETPEGCTFDEMEVNDYYNPFAETDWDEFIDEYINME